MKKIILIASMLATLLVGCEEEVLDINSLVTVTDANVEIVSGIKGSKSITYEKYGNISKSYYVSYDLIYQIESIKNVEELTNSESELYDVVTDGKKIVMITLSKNRK